jgi:hypothetical protein
MKINIKSILFSGLLIAMMGSSCKKENISLENKIPEIPVTVANKFGTFTAPAVSTSFGAGGAIQIILEIPASSGRTIKEITRVAANTSIGSVQVSTGLYNTAPIPGNGTTVTFNTTLTEYFAKAGGTPYTLATSGTATSFLAKNFYFMITLDNGQVIIPTHVRVYVDK